MFSLSTLVSVAVGGALAAGIMVSSGTHLDRSPRSAPAQHNSAGGDDALLGCGLCTPTPSGLPATGTGSSCPGLRDVTIKISTHGSEGFGRCNPDCTPGTPCTFPWAVSYTGSSCDVVIGGSDDCGNTYPNTTYSAASTETIALTGTESPTCGTSCSLTFHIKYRGTCCTSPATISTTAAVYSCSSCGT